VRGNPETNARTKVLMRAVGPRVRQARKRMGMTMHALAEQCGVTNQTIQRIEAGICSPSLGLVPVLCAELRVPADWLLGTAIVDAD
jgi:transcriptional regulator with XRE-family HTH domain